MKNEIEIVQVIDTIQGEGNQIGVPSTLIRFKDCNLKCPFCDTKWVNDLPEKRTLVLNEYNMFDYDFLIPTFTKNIRNLMITGGEPLLYSNRPIFSKFLTFINVYKFIEIETNGVYLDRFIKHDDINREKYQLNISPKLNVNCYKNSNDFSRMMDNCRNISNSGFKHYWFKFVYNGTDSDATKILNFIQKAYLPLNKICIMPLTPLRTKNYEYSTYITDYKSRCLKTLKFCLDNNFIFVPRMHIFLFENENEDIIIE